MRQTTCRVFDSLEEADVCLFVSNGAAASRRLRGHSGGLAALAAGRPLGHLNDAGLLWRIFGGKITSMETDWATIEINGAQRIIHRRPTPTTFVLPWRRPAP
jgi:hypothetical protein